MAAPTSIYAEYFDFGLKEIDFISTIPENVKPCFESHTFLSANSWVVTPMVRSLWYGEGRKGGLEHVLTVYGFISLYYLTCNNKDELQIIAETLSRSIQGIKNLQLTYDDDLVIKSTYEELAEKIIPSLIYRIEGKIKLMEYNYYPTTSTEVPLSFPEAIPNAKELRNNKE